MEPYDLLDAVQDPDGWIAIVGIKEGHPTHQTFAQDRNECARIVASMLAKERNVFFGVAKYKTKKNRKKENVLSVKAMWLDIDCGPTKGAPDKKGKIAGYLTQMDGLRALKKFCKNTGMPQPTIVNSGMGLHVYWELKEAVTREVWEAACARLRQMCLDEGLLIDTSVFEVARILRWPDTKNFKYDPPLPVVVEMVGKPHLLEELPCGSVSTRKGIFLEEDPEDAVHSVSGIEEEDKDYSGPPSNFQRILDLGEEGCLQLNACYEERDDPALDYNRWFNALSVAAHCEDRDTAVHLISEGHPKYDAEEVERKANTIGGPSSCKTFDLNNPGGCVGCIHAGTITNPIMLGKEIPKAVVGDEEVIFDYPWPYYRKDNKPGIWRKPSKEDEEPLQITSYDIEIGDRLWDSAQSAESVRIRLFLPKDPARPFSMTNTAITDPAEFRKQISSKGVTLGAKMYPHLMDFFVRSLNDKRKKKEATVMRQQFGWADDDFTFIIGNEEHTRRGVGKAHLSKECGKFAPAFRCEGTLEVWKKVYALYGRPGMERYAFGALAGFGAPLMKFTGQGGLVANFIHPKSGAGKSTMLHMINSIWGHPKELMGIKNDTENAKIMRLGVYNNLPVCYDEMTNVRPEVLSDMVYNVTQQKGKDRMKRSGNELRDNHATWSTIVSCSSNASFNEKLSSMKENSDAELLRVLEYKIEMNGVLDNEEAKQMFDHVLMRNFGHAGRVFIQFILHNYDEVVELVAQVQKTVDEELKIKQEERFWSAGVTAYIAGGIIAKRIGLIDWDIRALLDWVKREIAKLRRELPEMNRNADNIIGRFINDNASNIIIMQANKMGGLAHFMNGTIHKANIRWEVPNHRVMISYAVLKAWCVQKQINVEDTLSQLSASGAIVARRQVALAEGCGTIPAVPVPAVVLDLRKLSGISLVVPTAVEDDTAAAAEE